jgi:hypothetical protein
MKAESAVRVVRAVRILILHRSIKIIFSQSFRANLRNHGECCEEDLSCHLDWDLHRVRYTHFLVHLYGTQKRLVRIHVTPFKREQQNGRKESDESR